MITLQRNTFVAPPLPAQEVEEAYRLLCERKGRGNDFLGWMDPAALAPPALLEQLKQEALRLRRQSRCVVVAGIGGSYLGARAVIEALSPSFPDSEDVRILYAGHHLSEEYYAELLAYLDTVDYSIIVISKSGTTTETAVAFRLLRQHCERKYGSRAAERVVCITDRAKGALKSLAEEKGYPSYVLPDDVGGRYSVLSPVGLLPIAVAGLDVSSLLAGAVRMHQEIRMQGTEHPAVRYAALRNALYRQGFSIEVMATFEPKLQFFIEWWKQLFGESEGKERKGVFPAGVVYTTDLHSMGQFMQDGSRLMWETFLEVERPQWHCEVPMLPDSDNGDALNFLGGKCLHEINRKACLGTVLAHEDGGVPSLSLRMDAVDANHLGQLVYFFEFACGVSAYLLGVNPFDQPGVEAYKKNMFALLGKPGYEEAAAALQQRMQRKK
ncbi:MAG: glucose-6-phosphate isomerase [Bacteroidales bacterium]|nr:glucose-6-phosphate isomerase [Bacteroidales bacterium]